MGMTQAEVEARGMSLEGLGMISPPDEWLPWETVRAVARGRKLAKEHGW